MQLPDVSHRRWKEIALTDFARSLVRVALRGHAWICSARSRGRGRDLSEREGNSAEMKLYRLLVKLGNANERHGLNGTPEAVQTQLVI